MSRTVALLGNPNCGKTSLFNRLTGANQKVGNWPGVTVERREGKYRHAGHESSIIDLPGIYSLDPAGDDAGLDALIASEYLLGGEADVILNVIDASNLERNLYLTVQLLELGLPLVVALTMGDLPAARQRPVSADELSAQLACPVVKVNPRRGDGTRALRDALAGDVPAAARTAGPAYPAPLEAAVDALCASPAHAGTAPSAGRWHALALLSGTPADTDLDDALAGQRVTLVQALGEDVDIVLADSRYGAVRDLVNAAAPPAGVASRSASDRLDTVVLNRWLGIPLFLAAMYLMFMITIDVGGAFIDFFDILGKAVFVDGVHSVLSALGAPQWLCLLAEGVGRGVQTVATFIPIVGTLFLLLSALEDSGYMARAAFVTDRVMQLVGLPGRSVVPLMLGFGCTVPAVLATRTLEGRRDRLITIMMTPFMSCGARLPVYALFAVTFFPAGGQNVVFALYLVGIAAAVFTGLVLRSTLLLGGRSTPFVMELPPYRLPSLRGLLIHTWMQLKGFVFGAGKVIVPMIVVLTVLGSVSVGAGSGPGEAPSLLDSASRAVTPAFAPLGIREDNWPATVGIITGLFAKEALVGTLNSLYGEPARGNDDRPFSLWHEARTAVASVGDGLAPLVAKASNPVTAIIGVGSQQSVRADQGVSTGTFTEMRRRFDGQAGAFAFLLFVLLYLPCVAATGAIYRETTTAWTAFAVAWTTAVAFSVSVVAYQSATFTRHAGSSAAWITGILLAFALTVTAMRLVGMRRAGRGGGRAVTRGTLAIAGESPSAPAEHAR